MSQPHNVTVTDSVSHRLYESHTVVITDSVTCPMTVSESVVLRNVYKLKKSEMRKKESLEIRLKERRKVEYFSWGTLSTLNKKVNKWKFSGTLNDIIYILLGILSTFNDIIYILLGILSTLSKTKEIL